MHNSVGYEHVRTSFCSICIGIPGNGVIPAHQPSTRQKRLGANDCTTSSATTAMNRLKAFSSIRHHGGRSELHARTSSPAKLKYVDSIRRYPLQLSKSTNDMLAPSGPPMESIEESVPTDDVEKPFSNRSHHIV